MFINEEGTRFHRALFGSRGAAGLWEQADFDAADADGVGIAEHLKAIGGDPAQVGLARRHRGELHAYLELHIEQGPTLYRSGTPIGVVTGITGREVLQVSPNPPKDGHGDSP